LGWSACRYTGKAIPCELQKIICTGSSNPALRRFAPIAERHQANIGQTVIAWTFAQPGVTCVLCGARDAKQAIENAEAGRIVLSPEEVQTMDELMRAEPIV
jgi:aryl-alcohol dehydrogenase-like predicted oxidoreductase